MARVLWLLLGVALAVAVPVAAEIVTMSNSRPNAGATVCPDGVCINALATTSTRYTGWIPVSGKAKVTFGGNLVDANDSVTSVTVDCEWTNGDNTTVNTGYDICAAVAMDATATSTMRCPHTWSFLNDATHNDADRFSFTVDNLNARYLQCKFVGNGVPAAADTIYVEVMGRTP